MEKIPLTEWIEILLPDLEKHLGKLPRFTITTQPHERERESVYYRESPWTIYVKERQIYLCYGPQATTDIFISPTKTSRLEPHPNAIGRLVNDLLHELIHIYQAHVLYETGDERFFNADSHNLSMCGFAEFAAFEICSSLWQKSIDEHQVIATAPISGYKKITFALKRRSYKHALKEMLFWQVLYSFRAAFQKGWWLNGWKNFPPLFFLPHELQSTAIRKLAHFKQSRIVRKQMKPEFEMYDLGIYVGALLRTQHNMTLHDLIHNPLPLNEVLKRIGIKK